VYMRPRVNLFIFMVCILNLYSCGYLSRNKEKSRTETIELDKYQALEKKYQSLLKESLPSVSENTEGFKGEQKNFEKILESKSKRTLSGKKYNSDKIARELRTLERLHLKIKNKRYGDAVMLSKELESSGVEQIRAQARFFLALAMEKQGEKFLAVQIYEEVAVSMKFSIFAQASIKNGLKISKNLNDKNLISRFESLKRDRSPRGSN